MRANLDGTYDIQFENQRVTTGVAVDFITVISNTRPPPAAESRAEQRSTRDNTIITAANSAVQELTKRAGRVQADMALYFRTMTERLDASQRRALIAEARSLASRDEDEADAAAASAVADANNVTVGLRKFAKERQELSSAGGVLSYVHRGQLKCGSRVEGDESDLALFKREMPLFVTICMAIATPPATAARIQVSEGAAPSTLHYPTTLAPPRHSTTSATSQLTNPPPVP